MSIAASRLEGAMARADRAGRLDLWLDLALGHYVQVKDSGAGDEELAALRVSARSRAESLRARYRSRAGRLWAAQQLDGLFGEFLADELSPGPLTNERFATIEMGKARTLLDAMADPSSGCSAAELGAAAAKAESEMMGFEPPTYKGDMLMQELRLTSLLPIGTPWDRGERSARLQALEAEYARLGLDPRPVAPLATLDDVRCALRPDEVVVEFIVLNRRPRQDVWIAAISASEAQLLRAEPNVLRDLPDQGWISSDGAAPVDMSGLGGVIAELRRDIRTSSSHNADALAGERLRVLGEWLFGPLLASGIVSPASRLILVPHSVFHYVPFAALTIENRPLGEAYPLTLAPSAAVWLSCQRKPRPSVTRLLGLANPDLGYTHLASLPEAEAELETIGERLPGITMRLRSGPDATEGEFARHCAGASIVHLATHGEFPDDNALDMQRVLLAAEGEHDGRLHAEEIRALDLGAARLVALSVCNGGLYRFGPGDEPYGLIPAIMAAGAENAVATLWPIEDEVGRSFVSDVYRTVLAEGPAEALQRVRAGFRQDGALIRQWAAFVNTGCGRSLTD